MNDLGFTPPKSSLSNTPIDAQQMEKGMERKPQYPNLRFNGPQAESAGLTKCAHGDEYEMKIRVRARRIGGEDYEAREAGSAAPPMEFDVIGAEDPIKVEGEEEEAEEPEVISATAKKITKAPSPKEAGFNYGDDE